MVHENAELKTDALVRAWRTFGQGAVVAALVSVGTILTTLTASPDWRGVGLAALQAAGTAVVTYIHNRVSPTG